MTFLGLEQVFFIVSHLTGLSTRRCVFFSYQCPSSTNLVPTAVCRVCPLIQTLDTHSGQLLLPSKCLPPFFFPFLLSSAADAPCLACSRATTDKAKVTLMKSEDAFFRLFVCELSLPTRPTLSKLLPHDSFSSPPPILPNESHQLAPIERDMQISETGKQTACLVAAPPEHKSGSLPSQNGLLPRCLLRA